MGGRQAGNGVSPSRGLRSVTGVPPPQKGHGASGSITHSQVGYALVLVSGTPQPGQDRVPHLARTGLGPSGQGWIGYPQPGLDRVPPGQDRMGPLSPAGLDGIPPG